MPERTGWAFTDARNFHACPHCNAATEEYCKSPSGRRTVYPHGARVRLLATGEICTIHAARPFGKGVGHA